MIYGEEMTAIKEMIYVVGRKCRQLCDAVYFVLRLLLTYVVSRMSVYVRRRVYDDEDFNDHHLSRVETQKKRLIFVKLIASPPDGRFFSRWKKHLRGSPRGDKLHHSVPQHHNNLSNIASNSSSPYHLTPRHNDYVAIIPPR